MSGVNRTVFDIPLTWNRTRFEATRRNYRVARKLIEFSINVQFEKQLRGVFCKNIEIELNINDINQYLVKYYDKLRVLDNMIELASQSLRTYFDKRMESIRVIVNEHCNIIQEIIQEEAEHWKEIHAVLDQNLINPGDIRSRNDYPRTVQKSPASNIQAIEEEDEENVSKLINGKTLTPLLTQMIRKSRLQSKRLTLVPSSSAKINIPIHYEHSIPRKQERFSIHILPLSTTRQPLEIVDTTFVVKPEEATIEGEMQDNDDEPNGTYRAPMSYYHSHLRVPQTETSMIDSQPNIPARLCFSPTILQDKTVSSEDSFDNEEPVNTIFQPLEKNRTSITRRNEDALRFGQTFLLDVIKTEKNGDDQTKYMRPAIPDDDVIFVLQTNSSLPSSTQISSTANDNPSLKPDPPVQQKSTTVQETIPAKPRTRVTTKPKSKPVIVSARKTRSAAKDIAERAAAAAAVAAPVEKLIETKRKTRKRKQSKSIDHVAETSDDDNENRQSNSNITTNNKRKTKRYKKSKSDRHHHETSDDENENPSINSNRTLNNKRKTQKRINDHQQETSDDNENLRKTNKRKTQKPKEQSDNENTKASRKKTKVPTLDNEEEEKTKRKKRTENDTTKAKKRKRKTKKTTKDDEEQLSIHSSTRSSAKRDHR